MPQVDIPNRLKIFTL